MPRLLVVEDYGVPQARWELELVGEEEASPSASASAAAARCPALTATAMTVRAAKARFTREVFGVDAPDAWAFYRLPLGQPLDDDAPLAEVMPAATSASTSEQQQEPPLRVRAQPRFRGGGGDGGSTCAESRSCFLEMYAGKKPDKVDPNEEALARWTRCALTGEPLTPPVVADALGALMNKDAAVRALLDKALPEGLRAHVTGLRSLNDAKLAPLASPAEGGGGKAAGAGAGAGAAAAAAGEGPAVRFGCPVTATPMNGRFRFYLHRPSGVVISERALREAPRALVAEALSIALDDEEEEEEEEEKKKGKGGCGDARRLLPPLAALQQQAAAGEGDFLPINPTGPELARLRAVVLARAEAERERKAAKKKKEKKAKRGAEEEEGEGEGAAQQQRKRPAAEGAAAGAVAAASKKKQLRVPEGATPAVYASIFGKPGGEEVKETYCARAMSGR